MIRFELLQVSLNRLADHKLDLKLWSRVVRLLARCVRWCALVWSRRHTGRGMHLRWS